MSGDDGYFGMGRLSFGGIGKAVMSAVETTQMAVTAAPAVASTQGSSPAGQHMSNGKRPAQINTRPSMYCRYCAPLTDI